MKLSVAIESWPLARPFQITGQIFTACDLILVEVTDGALVGRGEGCGVYYHTETPTSMKAQIEAVAQSICARPDRSTLADLLPPGGARNAVDCALWDLEARRAAIPVWTLAGLDAPRPLLTTYTLGAEAPHVMAAQACALPAARALKLKLTGDGEDRRRVQAVRAARPDIWLAVDANQGFDRTTLDALLPHLVEARVQLIEQPCRIGAEAELDGLASPIPLAADESVQVESDLERLVGRFQVANIKLDKCGGLTPGLAMARRARSLGLEVMVGNMGGTSLSMSPAFLVGQLCGVVDLDGPTLLAHDRRPGVTYDDGMVYSPETIWGGPGVGAMRPGPTFQNLVDS